MDASIEQATPRERRRKRAQDLVPAAPRSERYRHLVNPFEPARVLSEDQVDAIQGSAIRILTEVGIRVLHPEARSLLAEAGARVEESDEHVFIDPELIATSIAAAPARFDIRSRTGGRDIAMGGDSVAFFPVAGPPNSMDLDRSRRAGTLNDFEDFVKLTQVYDVLHGLTPAVEPQDVPLEVRHLHMTLSQLLLSDKVPFIYCRGRAQVADCLEMIRLASGLEHEAFAEEPRCWTVINTNSPRQLDLPMCEGIIDFARTGQALVITPFTLAGAMAPVSLAGALTLQHAEALAGITLAQVARPGTPVVYGAFTSNVDMRSGAPAFGTPEAFKAAVASGQLARHLGLPWRSSGVNTSNTPDTQSAYETMINMFGALQGGANMIIHAAGWLESGLSASYEKFVLDVEMLQILAEAFLPIEVSEAEIGFDAIALIPPGGHFFGSSHTLERFRSAFYEPLVFARSNFEQWVESGGLTSTERANGVWKQVLAGFEAPPIDSGVAGALTGYVERRRSEGGALPRT